MCPRDLNTLSIASINQRNPRLTIVSYSSQEISKGNSAIFDRLRTLIGPMVQAGRYEQRITHYNVLRTIEELYGLSHSGASTVATPITHIWKSAPRP